MIPVVYVVVISLPTEFDSVWSTREKAEAYIAKKHLPHTYSIWEVAVDGEEQLEAK